MSEHSNPNSVAITCLQVAQTVITFDGAEWIAYRDAVRQCQSLQQRQEKQWQLHCQFAAELQRLYDHVESPYL